MADRSDNAKQIQATSESSNTTGHRKHEQRGIVNRSNKQQRARMMNPAIRGDAIKFSSTFSTWPSAFLEVAYLRAIHCYQVDPPWLSSSCVQGAQIVAMLRGWSAWKTRRSSSSSSGTETEALPVPVAPPHREARQCGYDAVYVQSHQGGRHQGHVHVHGRRRGRTARH